jgi:hypothetical protein
MHHKGMHLPVTTFTLRVNAAAVACSLRRIQSRCRRQREGAARPSSRRRTPTFTLLDAVSRILNAFPPPSVRTIVPTPLTAGDVCHSRVSLVVTATSQAASAMTGGRAELPSRITWTRARRSVKAVSV